MSILIKDMEMPRNCYECKVWFECFDEKPPFNMIKSVCPLVEVKEPHGDLVDKDKLMKEFMDSDLDHLQRDDWKEVIQIVADAPTVIEAERSEE